MPDYKRALDILKSHDAVEQCYFTVRDFVRANWEAFEEAGRFLMEHPSPKPHQRQQLRQLVAQYLPTVAPRG